MRKLLKAEGVDNFPTEANLVLGRCVAKSDYRHRDLVQTVAAVPKESRWEVAPKGARLPSHLAKRPTQLRS